MTKPYWTVGMMSGTSMDGIDLKAIKTDGQEIFEMSEGVMVPYTDIFREKLRNVLGSTEIMPDVLEIEKELTILHSEAFFQYLKVKNISHKEVGLIGFHGHTILHQPPSRFSKPRTWQIGDGELLSQLTKTKVVYNMRENDLKHGGEGAPLVPLYQQALAKKTRKPIAIINIGGISNVTWLGEKEGILAFDMGPGNALLDDWIKEHCDKNYDKDGLISAKGSIHSGIIETFKTHPYFKQKAPKSLDRQDFTLDSVRELSLEDGAATLAEMTAIAIKKGISSFPTLPQTYVITGGGRLNNFLMKRLSFHLKPSIVKTTEQVGWDGDFIEAEAFAFLAVRSLKKLPLTVPTTTGVSKAISGGILSTD
ncbi:anhydro-N-acetylmuramic acid kinase [Alphaproteobacteria bacterium]|nr:anhydro-N-acetylmuramic acid kinase [Alphaproteobacteria bacterium]